MSVTPGAPVTVETAPFFPPVIRWLGQGAPMSRISADQAA
jgi:hypothetical protein